VAGEDAECSIEWQAVRTYRRVDVLREARNAASDDGNAADQHVASADRLEGLVKSSGRGPQATGDPPPHGVP
jgi:hypothetical protein